MKMPPTENSFSQRVERERKPMQDQSSEPQHTDGDSKQDASEKRRFLLKAFVYPGLIMITVVLAALLLTNGMKIFPFFYSKF